MTDAANTTPAVYTQLVTGTTVPLQQANGMGVQSVAHSTAMVVQDGAAYLRNVSAMATAAIGMALSQLIATQDPRYSAVIQSAQSAVNNAAQGFQTMGTAAAAVLHAFAGGGAGSSSSPTSPSSPASPSGPPALPSGS